MTKEDHRSLRVDLGGNLSTGSPAGDHALFFARTWAERLADELPAAISASTALIKDDRAFERMEDWSPSEDDVARSFRRMWAANASVVWTGYQAQRWLRRLARELDEEPPDEVPSLKSLRDALEHLDSALFDDTGTAVTDPVDRRQTGLKKIGGLRVESWDPGGPLFALVDVAALRRLSQGITDRLHSLLNEVAEDYAVQAEIDRLRGK
ncbi:hypothetical protein [Curtobacterium sp. NPDC089991]|uniref:hypothetical protein n=1 Tax=Curtobacterium sp. NPDC089991 TaxID=3363969 RepID=UPI00382A7890